jgi:hypothetical protein
MITLQQQVGNAQIARMLAQRDAIPEEEELLQGMHDPGIAQRESAPEEEELLQGMHDPGIAQRESAPEEEELLQGMHDPGIAQRESAPEEEELLQGMHDPGIAQRHSDHEDLQAKPEVGLAGGPVSDDVANQINSMRGQGSSLSDSIRSSMEQAFGTSFEDVRVHTGTESSALNQRISARAFTTGNDIFLGQQASASDYSLMAHELTHVVQQRSMSGGGPMSVSPAGDSYEQQADQMASAVVAGQTQRKQKD